MPRFALVASTTLALSIAHLLALSSSAKAQLALPMTELAERAVRVDGMLRDWRGVRMTSIGAGDDGAMRFALGYDTQGLYVACDVADTRLVRNAEPGDGDDAVVLTLALPSARGLGATEIWLHPGEPGKAAVATIGPIGARRRSPIRDARVVEAPRPGGGGYTLEAFIPFSAIPGGARWQEGRGTIRLHDVDSLSHPEASGASFAPVDPAHLDELPPLRPSGGQEALLDRFLHERSLDGARPRFDLRGNVMGDPTPERVVLVDRYVVAYGPAIQDGRGFVFVELGIGSAGDLRDARLEDLTGDGLAELVVTIRQRGEGGSRDLLQVLRIDERAIAPLWGLETRKETAAGYVENTVRVERGRRGQPPTLIVRAGEPHGLDERSLRESPPTDVEPMLLAWGPAIERSFRWDGRTFARVGERPNPSYVSPEERAARERATARPSASEAPDSAVAAPTSDQLLAEFRRQRGIPSGARATRELEANVWGGRANERIALFGNELVIFGPDFRGGTGWFSFRIPAASPTDVLDLRAVDVTGDGRAEIVYRVRQSLGDISREVLIIHQLTESGFPVLLQREVARTQGANQITNEVRFDRGGLEVRPGTARGWTQASWPYAPTTSAGPDGIEPLLLPWAAQPQRYRFLNGRLVTGG